MEFLTFEAAKDAVSSDGKNICNMSYSLRDDEKLAWLAIENGASINDVSYRLQNDLAFSLKYAQYCADIGIVEEDFFRALYCAMHSLELLDSYCSKFANEPEFIILLKLVHEDNYEAPLYVLNDYAGESLRNIINQYHIDQINELKEEYYSSSYHEMCIKEGLQPANFIRNFALCARADNLPFGQIAETIRSRIERLDGQVDCYRSKSGTGSFPERLMDSVLRQLNVSFEREVVFDWSRPSGTNALKGFKRYDFYLPKQNAIIEVHGAQHYSGGFEVFGGRTLEEEKENDYVKQVIAQQNGISNYIVINAAVSTIPYIRESISSNSDFLSLFDVTDINWMEIKTSIQGRLDEDLPLYQLERSYYETLCELYASTIEDGDEELTPNKAFGDGCDEETPRLSEWKTKMKPSRNGLYPHEIILLSRAKGMACPVNADAASGTWFYDYGVSNIRPLVERLASKGFLHIGDLQCTLQSSPYSQLQKFATRKGLKGKGNKGEIVARILKNVPQRDILEAFPERYYDLTELGEIEIVENKYIFDAVAIPLINPMTRIWLAQLNPDKDIYDSIQEYLRSDEYRLSNDDAPDVKLEVSIGGEEFDDDEEYDDEVEYFTITEEDDDLYQIECALDKRTCEICGSMDQKVFKYSEIVVGVNYPPFHDGCRCCAVPYFEDMQGAERAARDRDGRTIYVKNMDWTKWKQIYGGKK